VTLPDVTVATADDRDVVVATVTAAFVDDPAFAYFAGGPRSYSDFAARFAGQLFDKRVSAGTVWVIEGGLSVAMWDAPAPSEPLQEREAGDQAGTNVHTADERARLAAYDAVVDRVRPRDRHWYLGVLATHPQYAGRRWGRAVMAAGLAAADRDGLDAYLETTHEENVGLYERSGWLVTHTEQIADITVRVLCHPRTR
jgi:ribosomal protein S18 acetylase RimI-like enzyme